MMAIMEEPEAVECTACGRRIRPDEVCGVNYVAGLVVSRTCLDCQTLDEHAQGTVNAVAMESGMGVGTQLDGTWETFRAWLLRSYSDRELMRQKADEVLAARDDAKAVRIARYMHALADDETLWR